MLNKQGLLNSYDRKKFGLIMFKHNEINIDITYTYYNYGVDNNSIFFIIKIQRSHGVLSMQFNSTRV